MSQLPERGAEDDVIFPLLESVWLVKSLFKSTIGIERWQKLQHIGAELRTMP